MQKDETPEAEDLLLKQDMKQEETDLSVMLIAGGVILAAAAILILIVFLILNPFAKQDKTASKTNSAASVDAADIVVPDIVGMTEQEAEQALSQVNLGIKYKGERASKLPAGTILEQSPGAGESCRKNATVTYIRSSSSTSLVMPELREMSLSDAKTLLSNKGCTNLQFKYRKSTEPLGTVIETAPSVDQRITTAEEIQLTISIGEATHPVRTGSYHGMTAAAAQSAAISDGLIADLQYGESDLVAVGEVMQQDIDPGSSVASGSVILLTVNEKVPEQLPSEDAKTISLGAPKLYQGHALRFVLETLDGGHPVERTLKEEEAVSFPYELTVPSTHISTGTLRLYEQQTDGSWSRIAFLPLS